MRTFGLLLVLLGILSGLFGVFYANVPFRIPLSPSDALVAAVALLLAGSIALLDRPEG